MYLLNGIPLREGIAFTGPDGVTYAPNWLARSTPEQRAEIGIVEEADPLPDPPAPPTTEQLIAYAADKRWRVETGGIVVSGAAIRTDEATQTKILGARVAAKEDNNYSLRWKGVNGFVTLNATQIIAIGDAIRAHVQASFNAEDLIVQAITATPPTITTYAEIDAYAWPSNT